MPKKKRKYEDVLRDHATALVAGMLAEAKSLATLEHDVTAGTYRELLIGGLLEHFLPSYLSISTGVIANSKGDPYKQSNQSDIIIYDNRILLPFLRRGILGLVPIESVIGVIEVKKKLSIEELRKSVTAAKRTLNVICTETKDRLKPLMGIFAFEGSGPRDLPKTHPSTHKWCEKHLCPIKFAVVAEAFACIRTLEPQGNREAPIWRLDKADGKTHDEVKRFIAVFLDNCRSLASVRFLLFARRHNNWLSSYIRD